MSTASSQKGPATNSLAYEATPDLYRRIHWKTSYRTLRMSPELT